MQQIVIGNEKLIWSKYIKLKLFFIRIQGEFDHNFKARGIS